MNINEQESNILILIGDCGNHRPSSPSYNKNHSLKKVINTKFIKETDNSSYYEYIGPQDLNSAKRIISELIPNN